MLLELPVRCEVCGGLCQAAYLGTSDKNRCEDCWAAAIQAAQDRGRSLGIPTPLSAFCSRDRLKLTVKSRRGPATGDDDFQPEDFERQIEDRARAENAPKLSRREQLGRARA
jgi:hypothetical protein